MIKKESLLYTFAFLVDGCISVVWFCIPLLALRLGASYEDLVWVLLNSREFIYNH